MLKSAFKSFVGNLVCFFIPMGIFYLILLLTLFWAFASLSAGLNTMLSALSELFMTTAQASTVSLKEFLAYSIERIDWNGGMISVFAQVAKSGWLRETVEGFFATLNVSTVGFEAEFVRIISEFSAGIGTTVALSGTFCALGIYLANMATRFAVRRSAAPRDFRKFLISHTLVPLAEAIITIPAVAALALIGAYGLLVLAALVFLSAGIALLSSWLIHRSGNVRLKDVLTGKNILRHLAVVGLMMLFDLVVAALLYLIDPVLCLLLMVPVLLYSANIVDVNTDRFVCGLVEERKKSRLVQSA